MPIDESIRQRIATKAVIVNSKGQVLVLREDESFRETSKTGRYQLVGGRLEPGETLEEGLKREVREETGLEIEIGQLLYAGEWRPVIKGVITQIVGLFYVCQAKTDRVRLSEEHDDYKWIDPKTYDQHNIMTPDIDVVKTYAQQG